MLTHAFFLRIPAEVWDEMEQEVERDKTQWIIQAIQERLAWEKGEKDE